MKKKLLLSALLAALCAFVVTGCGSSSSDDGPMPVTPVNLETPDSLVGTYEIDYFLTSVNLGASAMDISSDCAYAMANLGATACDPNLNVQKIGKASIVKNQDGTYSVVSKIQIWGGFFDNPPIPGLGSLIAPNMYNYTAYHPVNPDSINVQDKTINLVNTVAAGVQGRNMVALTDDNTAPFNFKVNDDGTITSTVQLSSPAPTTTKVVLRKVSDAVSTLDPNTLLDASIPGFEGFVSDFLSKFNGVYTVNFFGTSQTDGKCEGDNCTSSGGSFIAGFANLLYITNNCQYAIDNPDVVGVTVNAPDNTNQCQPGAGDVTMDAANQIAIEVKDGKAYVTTKTQLTNDLMKQMAPSDQYQYQQYEPSDTVASNGGGSFILTGTGLRGSNYNVNTTPPSISEPVAYGAATLRAELSADGNTIVLKTDIPGKVIMSDAGALVTVTAHVTMIAARTSGDYVAPVNEITADFLLNPAP